jgi:acyl-CoA hydrolase
LGRRCLTRSELLIDSNDATDKIGKLVAELVEDGATLQLGIGTIPDSVLKNLTNHKNLGIAYRMFSDGAIPLIKKWYD